MLKAFGFDAMIHLKGASLSAMQVLSETIVTLIHNLAHCRMHQTASSCNPCLDASIRVPALSCP